MKRLISILLLMAVVAGAAHADEAQDKARRMALRALIERAEQADAEAIYHLARLYESGYDSIPQDTLKSVALFRRAAELGNLPAQNYYGFLLYNGMGTAEDKASGLDWIKRAAEGGDLTAANNLGYMILNDTATECPEGYEEAAKWLSKAADGGVPSAISMLADLYREGKGVPTDTLQAISLYDRAIEAGVPDAQYKLLAMQHESWSRLAPEEAVRTGLHYYTHRAPTIAVTLFEQAADQGNAQAMALMGDALTRAQGASYDHDKALEYYFRAALAGNPSAQFVIAELLEIFPDALDTIDFAIPEKTPEYTDPHYWMEKASESGVHTAEDATRELYKL